MRVLFHHADPAWTGRSRVIAECARHLVERGARVVVACPPDGTPERRFGAQAGVTLRTLESGGGWLDESARLRRVLREEFSEVAIVHTAREHLVAAAALRMAERGAILRRVPAGATLRGARTERAAAFLATSGFIVSSDEDLGALALPRRPLRPAVVPPGVDVEALGGVEPLPRSALRMAPGTRVLVCAMDAESRVRAATVLRAFALLVELHGDLRLVLVGPGSDHEDLRMHAAALGVTHRVRFLGDRDDKHAVMRLADIGWVVAEHDAAVYGALDFMALRVPLVTERHPTAARYVADGITGALLPPEDAPASAAALATLLASPQARELMGEAARARAGRDSGAAAMGDALQHAVSAARDRTKWRRA